MGPNCRSNCKQGPGIVRTVSSPLGAKDAVAYMYVRTCLLASYGPGPASTCFMRAGERYNSDMQPLTGQSL